MQVFKGGSAVLKSGSPLLWNRVRQCSKGGAGSIGAAHHKKAGRGRALLNPDVRQLGVGIARSSWQLIKQA